jgi:hypothetical protein
VAVGKKFLRSLTMEAVRRITGLLLLLVAIGLGSGLI